jgi:RNA polymerase subunit RPABC4/transcription elongation factor Spt4
VVEADDTVCPHCGEAFTDDAGADAWEEALECDACGGLVNEADAVCPHCGARFD